MDAPIPPPHADDDEDVNWALSTASALWGRGERAEALKWLRRAAEAASDADADARSLELFKLAADISTRLSHPPPPPSVPVPQVASFSASAPPEPPRRVPPSVPAPPMASRVPIPSRPPPPVPPVPARQGAPARTPPPPPPAPVARSAAPAPAAVRAPPEDLAKTVRRDPPGRRISQTNEAKLDAKKPEARPSAARTRKPSETGRRKGLEAEPPTPADPNKAKKPRGLDEEITRQRPTAASTSVISGETPKLPAPAVTIARAPVAKARDAKPAEQPAGRAARYDDLDEDTRVLDKGESLDGVPPRPRSTPTRRSTRTVRPRPMGEARRGTTRGRASGPGVPLKGAPRPRSRRCASP